MNELTELEINTKIATIRGLAPMVVDEDVITTMGYFNLFDLSPTHRANKQANYFLTLMLEFQVSICHYGTFAFIESGYTDDRPHKAQHSFDDNCMVSFRKAVLLCIISAHKDV